VLDEASQPRVRAALLPAYVEVMLATSEVEAARSACRELEEIVASFESGILGAMAAHARGAVELADGDTLSLGDKTLTFLFTPWVHWPETMCTWLEEDKILFSCDFFGSHYATSDVFADKHEVYDGAKRYYAEIMMPFGGQVLKNLDKVTQYPIALIGPVFAEVDPSFAAMFDRSSLVGVSVQGWLRALDGAGS